MQMCLSPMFLNFQSEETPNMKPAEQFVNNYKLEIFMHDDRYTCKKQTD